MVGARAKVLAVEVLTSPIVGGALRRVVRDRARHQGLSFDLAGWSTPTAASAILGTYEKQESTYIRRHLRGAHCVVELGGSVGVTGSHALSVMPEGGRLISVEANPFLIPTLTATLQVHGLGRTVEVVHAAIADQARAQLAIGSRTWGSSLTQVGGVEVPALSLNALLKERGVDRYALVSDIEGAEAAFIVDTDLDLEGCDRMVIELHDTVHHGRRVSASTMADELVRRHGFRLLERRSTVLALAR